MVFPLLVMLMFAIIVVGQAIYMAATAQWAIERGVRELMISSQASGSALARDLEETVHRLSGLEVTVNYEEDGSGPLPVARMFTSVSIPIVVPFLPTYQFNYTVESYVPRPFEP